jgi:ABC-type glycerol-3-phosphate transport system substrate-binding protein
MKCAVESTIANPKWPKIESDLNDELGAAIYGNISPTEALDKAAEYAREATGT